MSMASVRAIVPVVLLTIAFIIVMGVIHYVRSQLPSAGLTWPTAFDNILSTLTSFGGLVVIVSLAALVIFALMTIFAGAVAARAVNMAPGALATPVAFYTLASPAEILKALLADFVNYARRRASAGIGGGLLVLIYVGLLVLVIGIAVGVGHQVITQFNQTTGSIPSSLAGLLTTISNFSGIIVLVVLASVIILILLSAFTGIARAGR